jgi:hypothetical protein
VQFWWLSSPVSLPKRVFARSGSIRLDGSDVVIGGADAEPPLEAIRAFRVPGDAAVMLRQGAWHASPLFQAPQASFFNLELSDTNVTDHGSCDLVRRYGTALRVVADAA